MLYRTMKIVVIVALLAVCSDVSAQYDKLGANYGYSGPTYGDDARNYGFTDQSSEQGLHSRRFRNNCGRGITQMQAAALWAGYCDENCGYTGGSQSCDSGCRSGCRLGSRLHGNNQSCGCQSGCRWHAGRNHAGLFSKNRNQCGCSGACIGESVVFESGNTGIQSVVTGSVAVGTGTIDSAPAPVPADAQPSVSDTVIGGNIPSTSGK